MSNPNYFVFFFSQLITRSNDNNASIAHGKEDFKKRFQDFMFSCGVLVISCYNRKKYFFMTILYG